MERCAGIYGDDTHLLTFASGGDSPLLRLFCFPHAGSGAVEFHAWQNLLPPGVQVVAVTLPGRERRIHETAMDDLAKVIHSVEHEIAPYLDRPFALFGHSLGALIAFELTCVLEASRLAVPVRLLVSACRSPTVRISPPYTHLLPDDDFIRDLRMLDGINDEIFVHKELMNLVLPALRADVKLYETYTYRPRPYLRTPITALGGSSDPSVAEKHVAMWRECNPHSFRMRVLPGGHFYIRTYRELLLDIINVELSEILIQR